MVKDIAPPPDGGPSYLTVVGNTLFFVATDGSSNHGYELWKSDGTGPGTNMFKDINIYGDGSPYGFAAIGTSLYFVATDSTSGLELWKSDGVVGGTTVMVKDINPGSGSGDPSAPVYFNGSLYF